MSISAYYVQSGSVMRYAAGTADRYGRPAETWAEAAAVPGRLSVVDGRETQDGKEIAVTKLRWYMASGSVTPEVAETDRIRIDGEDYEIVLVAARRVGTGAVHHLEIDPEEIGLMDQGELFVKFYFDPERITDETRAGLIAAMESSTAAVARRAEAAAPRGKKKVRINGRDQRRLGESILSGVRDKDSGPIGFVNVNERHAKVVEYGGVVGRSDPHAGKHPGRIHRKYQEHPFLIPAFEAEKSNFENLVNDVMDKAMATASDKDDLI